MPSRLIPSTTRPALLVGLLLLLGGATVEVPPPLATAGTLTGYVGTVTVNGQPATAGSTLVARIRDTVVGTCTVAASGTYQLELTDAVLEASQTGATVRFTLNDQGIAETAVLRPGTMQALALNVSQPASTGQRIASAPAAASVPVVVATPAAQRIASAPSTSSPATATPASTPSVPAAAAPVAAAAPTLPSPVTQVAGVNSGPTAQQPARLPSAPSTTHPAAVTTPSTVVAAQNAPIARAGAAIASTPVASAPVAQRTAGSTPTQLPSTGVGLRVDTSPTLMMVLTTLLVTVTGLGSALAATHWRRATARQEEQ